MQNYLQKTWVDASQPYSQLAKSNGYIYRDLIETAFPHASSKTHSALNSLFTYLIPKQDSNHVFTNQSLAQEILEMLEGNKTLINRIERRKSDIIDELRTVELIEAFTRNQPHYDLVIVLITGNSDLSSITSSILNFSQATNITYSRTVILLNPSEECKNLAQELLKRFNNINPCLFDEVEQITYNFTEKSELALSKITEDIGCKSETILIVSDYGVLESLHTTLKRGNKYNKEIELFCGETSADILPSTTFIQRKIKDLLLTPLKTHINTKISARN